MARLIAGLAREGKLSFSTILRFKVGFLGVSRYRDLAVKLSVCLLLILALPLTGGCLPILVSSDDFRERGGHSFGAPADGYLAGGVLLPDRGEGYIRARRGEESGFGTQRLVTSITDATAAVSRRFPGTYALRIGDLSSPFGGKHSRHNSHRNGRDVDILFYVMDLDGVPRDGRGWIRFDRDGLGDDQGEVVRFDVARNWQLLRTMLTDPKIDVQWIFVSASIKRQLLHYASTVEQDRELLVRASWMIHQPSRGNPHADHFHIRITCTSEEVAFGCRHGGPRWPWRLNQGEQSVEPLDAPHAVLGTLRPESK